MTKLLRFLKLWPFHDLVIGCHVSYVTWADWGLELPMVRITYGNSLTIAYFGFEEEKSAQLDYIR